MKIVSFTVLFLNQWSIDDNFQLRNKKLAGDLAVDVRKYCSISIAVVVNQQLRPIVSVHCNDLSKSAHNGNVTSEHIECSDICTHIW